MYRCNPFIYVIGRTRSQRRRKLETTNIHERLDKLCGPPGRLRVKRPRASYSHIGPCAPISPQGICPLLQDVMTANTGGIRLTRPSSLRNLNQK